MVLTAPPSITAEKKLILVLQNKTIRMLPNISFPGLSCGFETNLLVKIFIPTNSLRRFCIDFSNCVSFVMANIILTWLFRKENVDYGKN